LLTCVQEDYGIAVGELPVRVNNLRHAKYGVGQQNNQPVASP
jgi:hypothetical protein